MRTRRSMGRSATMACALSWMLGCGPSPRSDSGASSHAATKTRGPETCLAAGPGGGTLLASRLQRRTPPERSKRATESVGETPADPRTLRLLVVPALFSDSTAPTATATELAQVLFSDAEGPTTLKRYYETHSSGRITLDGSVAPWVRTDVPLAQAVGSYFGLGGDAELGDYIAAALSQADASIDFSALDDDGPDGIPNSGDDDGRVDFAVIEFNESSAACGGSGPWGHKWKLSEWTGAPFESDDVAADGSAIVVDDYIVLGATGCGTQARDALAVLAHEVGHALGLPDLYDASQGVLPSQRRWMLGCWDIMAGGAWDCPTTSGGPPPLGAWSRTTLGFTDVVDAAGAVELEASDLSERVARITLPGGERVLIEHRRWDDHDGWTAGSGLLLTRDVSTDGFPLGRPLLMEADGDGALSRSEDDGGNRGSTSDAFTSGSVALGSSTDPSVEAVVQGISVTGDRARFVVARP